MVKIVHAFYGESCIRMVKFHDFLIFFDELSMQAGPLLLINFV